MGWASASIYGAQDGITQTSLMREISALIERLLLLSARAAFSLVIVGGALDLSIRSGLIAPTALGGYVQEAAPVMWATGAAVLLAAATSQAPELFESHQRARRERRESASRKGKLVGNISFLDDSSLLLLYIFFKIDSGRLEYKRGLPFERLVDLELIRPENVLEYHAPLGPQGILRLAPELWEEREALVRDISRLVSKKFRIDADSEEEVARALKAVHDRRAAVSWT
jgi:hypothetical protein